MKDAQYAETNEKTVSLFFWFLVFELWSSILTVYLKKMIPSIYSFWDMVDFVLKIRSELVWDIRDFCEPD